MASDIRNSFGSLHDEYDFEDENSLDLLDDHEFDEHDSDEDTEDASETDMVKQQEEYSELKEQFYQDKLANLKKQLQQLKEDAHPEFNRRLKKLEQAYKERMRLADLFKEYEITCAQREYDREKKLAQIELEEKMIELQENLIAELEEKKRIIESERTTIELMGDSMEVKPVTTRKLRRRPNDPLPLPEKRRKTSPAQLNYLLDESTVLDDLRIINKVNTSLNGRPIQPLKKQASEILIRPQERPQFDVKIEEGKFFYDNKWFHRGQPVYVEMKDTRKFSGVISTIAPTEIFVRKTSDGSKIRIQVTHLQKGKYIFRRRST